jgi:hypothetical protein
LRLVAQSTLLTDLAYHCPPRGVLMPRAVEGIRYLMKGRSTRALYLADDRKHVSCMAVGKGLDGR